MLSLHYARLGVTGDWLYFQTFVTISVTFMIVINANYFLLLYRRHLLKQNWFAKCLAEEGSVYTQRAMVSASSLDSI